MASEWDTCRVKPLVLNLSGGLKIGAPIPFGCSSCSPVIGHKLYNSVEVVRKAVAHVQLVLGSCQWCHECQGCAERWASNSFPLVVNTYSQKNWFCIGVIHLGTQILYIYIYMYNIYIYMYICIYIYRWVIDVINQWMSGYPVGHLGSKKWLGELLNCVLPRFGAVLMTTRAQRNASNVVNLAAGESPICGNWTLKKVPGSPQKKGTSPPIYIYIYIYIYICAYIRLPKMTVLFVWGIPSCQKCHGPKITLDHPLGNKLWPWHAFVGLNCWTWSISSAGSKAMGPSCKVNPTKRPRATLGNAKYIHTHTRTK